jgi:hypothetical protein
MSKFKNVIDMLITLHSKEINELQTENEKLKVQVEKLKEEISKVLVFGSVPDGAYNALTEALESTEQEESDEIKNS